VERPRVAAANVGRYPVSATVEEKLPQRDHRHHLDSGCNNGYRHCSTACRVTFLANLRLPIAQAWPGKSG
jgi:hypothetical protein